MLIDDYWYEASPSPQVTTPTRTNPLVEYIKAYTTTPDTDDVSEEEQKVWLTRHISYGIIGPILISVGILGNILTILLLRNKRFEGVTYTLFRFLALSDLIGLLFCISFVHHLQNPLTTNYSTAFWYAHFEAILTNAPFSMSVFIVLFITVDRYFSVCRPTQFRVVHTERNAKISLISGFALAVIIWIPACLVKTVTESTDCESFNFDNVPDDNVTYYVACMEKNTRDSRVYMAYSWTRQTVVTFIPIIILVVLNGYIIKGYYAVVRRRNDRTVNSYQSTETGQQNSNNNAFLKEDTNLIKMLYAIMISFFVTMLPPGIGNALYTEFLSTNLQYEIFRAVANDLEILNHALNFYLYILLSKPLRVAIEEVCSTKWKAVQETWTRLTKKATVQDEPNESNRNTASLSKTKDSRPDSKISILSELGNLDLQKQAAGD